MAEFNVGDRVTWRSQAGGTWKAKTGEVVEVVPAGVHPLRSRGAEGRAAKYNLAPVDGAAGSSARKKVSYLVAVPAAGSGAPKLYWPVASRLKAAP
jgi:hypothetical protein